MNLMFWVLVVIVTLPIIFMFRGRRRVNSMNVAMGAVAIGIVLMVGYTVFSQVQATLINQTIQTTPTTIMTPSTIITTTTSTTLNMEDVWNKRLTEYYSGSK